MAVYNEGIRLPDVLRRELDPGFCREEVTVAQGQTLSLGAVLGRRTVSCPTAGTPKAGNTGNGALDLVTPGPALRPGVYRLVCSAAAANGGTFQVYAPDGARLADAQVGVEYDQPQIGFVISDGGTDFAVGDAFTIEVSEGDGQVVLLNPDALDGTQIACGLLIAPCDAAGGPVRAVAVTRDAIIRASNLAWPADITAPEKALALKQLAARGIIDRKGV